MQNFSSNFSNTLIFCSLTLLSLIFLPFFNSYFIANAQEDIITIVPGSSDSSRYRFFDITEYPISIGEEIKWYNADDIVHNIVIFFNNGKDILAQSENIKPKDFFSYTFENEGVYIFQSSKYDWMNGKIIVTEDLKTIKKTTENDLDIYLSLTPSSINVGEKVLFKITFVDNKSEKNQEHVDYSFTIENPASDKVLYKNPITHSAWGLEPASHIFNFDGSFIVKVVIEGILFQPIEPEFAEFELQVVE
jgi:plastocyanin